MTKRNNKQDILLARHGEQINALKETFLRFIDNDFKCLKKRVDWILWILILGGISAIVLSRV